MGDDRLHLYVPTMDAVLADFRADGAVRFSGEDWSVPTLQETRAILHAAETALRDLTELVHQIRPAR